MPFSGLVCAHLGLDPPGANFCGPPGWGESAACKFPSATYGWDPTKSTRLGFGFPWRTKVAALENYAAGCNHTLLFLDEMSQASQAAVEAIMMVAHGHATARYTELTRQTWSVPLLSNSNKSLLAILLALEFEFDAAYVDRLPDIPPPTGCTCFFEDLHGSCDVAEYEARLRGLAEQHHGWAGWHYAKRFERALAADPEELQRFIEAAREEYRQAAAGITSGWRDLVRLHSRFATIYASGCLAHRFRVLPLSPAELLAADLTCARDHVAFVEKEVRRLGVPVSPAGAQPTNTAQDGSGTLAVPDRSPLTRLTQYLEAKIPNGLIDLRDPATALPQNHDHDNSPGYIGIHDGAVEIWLSNARFEKIAGGKRESRTLKRLLVGSGVVKVWGRGNGKVGPTVKRHITNLGLCWVVAMMPSKAMKARLPTLRDRKRQELSALLASRGPAQSVPRRQSSGTSQDAGSAPSEGSRGHGPEIRRDRRKDRASKEALHERGLPTDL
jgi:hypothetical protein